MSFGTLQWREHVASSNRWFFLNFVVSYTHLVPYYKGTEFPKDTPDIISITNMPWKLGTETTCSQWPPCSGPLDGHVILVWLHSKHNRVLKWIKRLLLDTFLFLCELIKYTAQFENFRQKCHPIYKWSSNTKVHALNKYMSHMDNQKFYSCFPGYLYIKRTYPFHNILNNVIR